MTAGDEARRGVSDDLKAMIRVAGEWGYTQGQLAQEADVAAGTLSRMANGALNISQSRLDDLEAALERLVSQAQRRRRRVEAMRAAPSGMGNAA